jgi:hypothetical protein
MDRVGSGVEQPRGGRDAGSWARKPATEEGDAASLSAGTVATRWSNTRRPSELGWGLADRWLSGGRKGEGLRVPWL